MALWFTECMDYGLNDECGVVTENYTLPLFTSLIKTPTTTLMQSSNKQIKGTMMGSYSLQVGRY